MKKVGRTVRRRRVEGKTDYKLRFGLLKSEKPRIVVRRTNRYIIGQIVTSDVAKDKVVISANSRELLNHGWPKENSGSLKSRVAAYLTGYLLGTKSKDIKGAIFDIGLARNIHGSRLYAFLKGAIDAGMEINHKESALPSDEVLGSNEKVSKLLEKVKGAIK